MVYQASARIYYTPENQIYIDIYQTKSGSLLNNNIATKHEHQQRMDRRKG